MIIDCRTYTLRPRVLQEYLKIFEEHGLAVQQRHLNLIGYYYVETGPLNQIVHMWGYEDMADMEKRRAARNADPDWKKYQSHTEGMVISQETKLLRPANFAIPAFIK